jgi:hypothetical protein
MNTKIEYAVVFAGAFVAVLLMNVLGIGGPAPCGCSVVPSPRRPGQQPEGPRFGGPSVRR